MKATVIREFGPPEVLRYEEIATPEPRPGHVVIKILAAGVNRFDHYIREGSVAPQLPFPHVLGADAAGEIAALGQGVTGLAVGDRVVPLTGYPVKEEEAGTYPVSSAASYTVAGLGMPGTYAQFMQIPAAIAARSSASRFAGPAKLISEAGMPLSIATSTSRCEATSKPSTSGRR